MVNVLVQIVFEFLCGLTGYAVLRAGSLGRWNPVKKNGEIDSNTDTICMIVGFLFWAVVGVGIWYAFFR